MKNSNLVSIITPIYNGEKYFNECMNSILRQSYENIEVILIDDGSTDSSGDLSDKYESLDSRVRVIHQKNGGVSRARNAGLDIARGDFAVFIDADDTVHIDYVSVLMEDASRYEADIVTTTATRIDDMSDEPVEEAKVIALTRDEAILELYKGRLEGTRDGMQMISMSVLNGNGIRHDENMAIGEDFDFLARCILKSNKVVVDKRRMYSYRKNLNSAMQKSVDITHFEAVDNVAAIGRSIEGGNPELKRAIDTMVFSDTMYYASKAYGQRQEWPAEYNELLNNISKYKRMVLFNKDAKKNTRIKALIVSVLGNDLGVRFTRRLIRW